MSLFQEINENLKLQKIEEAGAFQRGLGRVASAIGMQRTGANLQAQGQGKQDAKTLDVEFNRYLGTVGKNANTATVNDLATFLDSKHLPVPSDIDVRKTGNLTLKQMGPQVKGVFQKAIQGGHVKAAQLQAQQPQETPPVKPKPKSPIVQGGTPQQAKQQGPANPAVNSIVQQVIQSITPVLQNSVVAALQKQTKGA